MINKFLSAKHWQLFIPLFGIPFLLQTFMMQKMFSNITTTFDPSTSTQPPSFEDIGNLFGLNMGVTIIYMVLFYIWLWSIGFGLNSKIPRTIDMSLGKFKFALIFPAIYMIGFIAFLSSAFLDPSTINFGYFALIIPFHLLAMFCIFYCLYFVAKTIKTAELKEELRFSDFVAEFLLLWVYPVGIWILQPRINALHASELDDGIEQHLVD